MKIKQFFGKFANAYLWGHLVAMALVVIALAFGVKYGLEIYTHHGEGIKVPDLSKMSYEGALQLLESDGLRIMVSDSGYNKRLPADCILAQTPGPGTAVKQGHIIYVTVNSPTSPSFTIPDIVDNSSVREAEAKLTAMGFRLLPAQEVPGERDWVYGIVCRGRRVSNGDRIPIDYPLTLLVGGGSIGESDDFEYVDQSYSEPQETTIDDFEEVTEPATGN
jgi:beta-lactam-binding protein with PASTA domain